MVDGAVALLDHQTGDTAPAEIGCEGKTDRTCAGNQNGDVVRKIGSKAMIAVSHLNVVTRRRAPHRGDHKLKSAIRDAGCG